VPVRFPAQRRQGIGNGSPYVGVGVFQDAAERLGCTRVPNLAESIGSRQADTPARVFEAGHERLEGGWVTDLAE
jgi:hypothetical protein